MQIEITDLEHASGPSLTGKTQKEIGDLMTGEVSPPRQEIDPPGLRRGDSSERIAAHARGMALLRAPAQRQPG
jgi:hypothetical protein